MTEQATISKYQAFKIELCKVENELKNPNLNYRLYTYLKKKQELLQKKLDEMSLFEVWYDFFDGTMANSNGYRERVEVYKDKEKALQRIDELNGDDREKPYYLKVVELNGRCSMGEFKCYLDENKNCDECNECILCYKCTFLREKIEDVEVICQIKGQVDLHNTCFYYTGDVDD